VSRLDVATLLRDEHCNELMRRVVASEDDPSGDPRDHAFALYPRALRTFNATSAWQMRPINREDCARADAEQAARTYRREG